MPAPRSGGRLLTREEFRARVRPPGGVWRNLRAGFTPAVALGFALLVGGLGGMLPLFEFGERHGFGRYLPWWWVLPVCWGVMYAGLPIMRRDLLRRLRGRGLLCPSCAEPLITVSPHLGGTPREEIVMATGRCPSCGATVLHVA